MTRDAKLYILSNKGWEPLSNLINNDNNIYLQRDITIYQLFTSTSKDEEYAIITLSDKADKIVEEYGAILSGQNDSLKTTLHDYFGEPLFGDKSNVIHLQKLQ